MMDIKENQYKSNEIIFLAKNKFSIPLNVKESFKCLDLERNIYQRFFSKIFSLYIPPLNILLTLFGLYFQRTKIILYCSWMFEEAEFISNWQNCIEHFYLEDGQLGQIAFSPYPNSSNMQWGSRKKVFKEKRSQLSFRLDCSGFLCITEGAYSSQKVLPKVVYKDFESCLDWYQPMLLDIKTIIIGPHPKRLAQENYLKSVLNQCFKLNSRWALKLHWGVYSYKKLYREILEEFSNIDPSIGTLCNEFTIIEIEMYLNNKNLYGNVTSLALYAKKFGSTFQSINFEGYKGYEKGENFFMPKNL